MGRRDDHVAMGVMVVITVLFHDVVMMQLGLQGSHVDRMGVGVIIHVHVVMGRRRRRHRMEVHVVQVVCRGVQIVMRQIMMRKLVMRKIVMRKIVKIVLCEVMVDKVMHCARVGCCGERF